MEDVELSNTDVLVMKLLHYFITDKSYNPIVLHGVDNEIWLENMDSDYKIVRIVSNYIHNDEQLNFDVFKTKKIVKKIKKQTLSFNINILSIFINLGDNVNLEKFDNDSIVMTNIKDISDFKDYKLVIDAFPDITNKTNFDESGMNLFLKLTGDINKKSELENTKSNDIFKIKKPYVTGVLIGINILIFLLMYILGNGSENTRTLIDFGALYKPFVLNGEYFRIITSSFLHIGIFHLFFNCYALYVIGRQLESFLGRFKFLIVYFVSTICGSLMSLIFTQGISAGASGAIFGLLGSTLYFGYNYRVYLGNVLKSQIIPLIIFNLLLGFYLNGVDNASHIGGMIGGALVTMALGVKYKSSKADRINGVILSIIYILFLGYMVFFK